MTSEAGDPVRLGVVGLGRGFALTAPAFRGDPRIRLVAAAAPREESRLRFVEEFGGRAYATLDGLLADPEVEAVYVATPHQMHLAHTVAAAEAGKHLLVEKPLAVSMAEGRAIVKAAERAAVHLIVGPSHSFDAPVAEARRLIESGALGAPRMIQSLAYTDFLYRPRRPEELDTRRGGGVTFSQGIHQIDVARLLAGGLGREATAMTGIWDRTRPTEGAYAALLSFEGGCFATLAYSGYGHFDSDIWMEGIGELGAPKDEAAYGAARRAIRAAAGQEAERRMKAARTYGGASAPAAAVTHEHFGPVIVLCEKGDIRLLPDGLEIWTEAGRERRPAPALRRPRAEIADALVAALREGRPPVQTGRWGLASLEICHAILESAATGRSVRLVEQVACHVPGGAA